MEKLARHGDAKAQAALDDTGPECPDALRYLLDWIWMLHGRSGVGMNGIAPLSWGTLGEWSRFTGNAPDPEDIDALFLLDAVLSQPVEG